MPWFRPGLDHDFEEVLGKLKLKGGPALDLGTGPGTQAIALAKRGFKVTATDISGSAVRKARILAKKEKVAVHFREDDVLKTKLKGPFDLIFDRGCFHTLLPRQRTRYIRHMHRLLKEGGYLFLKCFSRKEVREEGPYRFKPEEIQKLFGKAFKVRIKHSRFQGVLRPNPFALFCILQKEQDRAR